jgi:hypothetical protein
VSDSVGRAHPTLSGRPTLADHSWRRSDHCHRSRRLESYGRKSSGSTVALRVWIVDADGQTRERIYDVAASGGRTIGPDGRCRESVGNTVDVANATYTNDIGAAVLAAHWRDPDFDPDQRAFYYVRVIEIPTSRWTAYDAL